MSTSISGRRIGRAVLVGPLLTFQKPIYACALAGEIPDRLSINFIARLASASLVSPEGGGPTEDQWRSALVTLAQASRLTFDDDRRVTPEALSAVLPDLKAAGLEFGEALRVWLGPLSIEQAEQAKPTRGHTAAREARTRDASAAAQPWAQEWQREWQPIMRVLGGAQSLGKLAALVDGCEFRFAPPDLIAALLKWDGGRKSGVVPQKSEQTLSRALKGFAPGFSWRTGNPGAEEKDERISLLAECYQLGKEADNDEELGGLLDSAGLGPLLRVA